MLQAIIAEYASMIAKIIELIKEEGKLGQDLTTCDTIYISAKN